MFDEMVIYVPQLKKILSLLVFRSIGSWGICYNVLKMTRGLMVILKGVWCNNLYYLKSSMVTGQVTTSTNSDNDCTQLWHMRLGHTGKKTFASSCKVKFIERYQYLQIRILWALHHRKENQGEIWHRNSLHRGDSVLFSHRCLGTYEDGIYWR